MAIVTLTICLSSDMDARFERADTLEIDDEPLGNGGFGAVHACVAIDGAPPPAPIVVKLLTDDETGSDATGWETLRNLCHQARDAAAGRLLRGEPPLSALPALYAFPLLCFEGTYQQKRVYGCLVHRLDTAGYVSLDSLAEGEDADTRQEYLTSPMEARLTMAAQLAEGLAVLREELFFVHADINLLNIWINPAAQRICLIDYDGGAVMSVPGARANVCGKSDDFAAPEQQLALATDGAEGQLYADFNTDAWSVMVAIAYTQFLAHPLLFLGQLDSGVMREYAARYRWPEIAVTDPNFSAENAAVYDWFLEEVAALPAAVKRGFERTLHEGFFDPSQRPSPREWMLALRDETPLPEIQLFEADTPICAAGEAVTLRWWVEGALAITITPGIGRVVGIQSLSVQPTATTVYTLTATGAFGEISQSLRVEAFALPDLVLQSSLKHLPLPRLPCLPAPRFPAPNGLFAVRPTAGRSEFHKTRIPGAARSSDIPVTFAAATVARLSTTLVASLRRLGIRI